MANPYLRAWSRRRAAQRRVEGRLRPLLSWLPLLAVAAAGPLVRPIFMGFLSDPARLAEGTAALGVRLGLVLCGAMALATYTALVRGPERAILDPHPARSGDLVRYLLLRTGLEKAPWVLGAAALCLPVLAAKEPLAYGVLVAQAAGGWSVGLLAGFTVHLGSVWAAESESLAWILNLLRGQNPKLQAALIYGPGVVLALGGAAIVIAARGAAQVLDGQPLGAALLFAPVLVGALAWLPTPGLAERFHFRTTLLLAEIDAAYAGQEDPEEARRVYLEWAVRFVPAGVQGPLLRELRHGWRGLRSWVTGAWGLGTVALLSAWSAHPIAGPRTLVIAGAGIVLVALVGIRLAATDPEWLDQALPVPRSRRVGARALAIFGWLQGVLLLPLAALVVRQGLQVAFQVALPLQVLALALAISAAGFSMWRVRGTVPYLVLGLIMWSGVAGLAAGGVQ